MNDCAFADDGKARGDHLVGGGTAGFHEQDGGIGASESSRLQDIARARGGKRAPRPIRSSSARSTNSTSGNFEKASVSTKAGSVGIPGFAAMPTYVRWDQRCQENN